MSEHRTSTGNPTIDELDKKIICALQGDFPLVAEPYKAMAEQIGVSEELFLARVKAMADSKKIRKMAESPSVSHCYDRTTAPDWPYNLYTMVHGHSREECEQIVAGLADETGVEERAMLYTKREWKKISMKYFQE